jgi:hypothetical protein
MEGKLSAKEDLQSDQRERRYTLKGYVEQRITHQQCKVKPAAAVSSMYQQLRSPKLPVATGHNTMQSRGGVASSRHCVEGTARLYAAWELGPGERCRMCGTPDSA